VCRFVTLPEIGPLFEKDIVELYSVVSGCKLSVEEMIKRGAEIVNLARRINEVMGLKKHHDSLPEFFFREPIKNGNSRGAVVKQEDFEKMLHEYYKLRGWSF
jgi:aldehyde:ferredoxin oxidoreductase